MNDLILASVAYASGSPHARTFLEPEKRSSESRASSEGVKQRRRLPALFARRRKREVQPIPGHSAWA